MPEKKNKQLIFVDKNVSPSRFLLDLNKQSKEGVKVNTGNTFEVRKPSLEKTGVFIKGQPRNRQGRFGLIFTSIYIRLSRLTFFPLISLVIKLLVLIIKLCYGVGWTVVFFVRLLFVLPIKVLSFLNVFRGLNSNKREIERDVDRLYTIFNNKIPKEKLSEKIKRNLRSITWRKPVKIKPILAKLGKIRELRLSYNFGLKNALEKIKLPSIQAQPQRSPLKAAACLGLAMITLVLPLKAFTYYKNINDLRGKVMGVSESAINNIKEGAQLASANDFNGASINFARASADFLTAEKEVREISDLLAIIAPFIPNKDVKMAAQADLVLEAGRLSTKIAEDLSLTLSGLSAKQIDAGQTFSNFCEYSQVMNDDVRRLSLVVQQIDPTNLPEEYQVKFKVLQDKIVVIEKSAYELFDLANKLKIFLGFDVDKRYLIVFQNNAEMRASGGFIGSYAIVDFSNGKIKNIEVPGGGSYDTEWGLIKKIVAPEALSVVNPRWYFWDANWWPDWPTTAKKLMWFYELSERRTVDGVISITPTAFEKILAIMGPIDMQAKYGLTFNADNFWELTENLAEQKPVTLATTSTTTEIQIPKHEPKKIIGDLINSIKEELPKRLDRDKFLSLLVSIEEDIEQKHVLLYFNDKILEDKVVEYGADGKIKETNWDYLMVVDTNIAGGKSDRKIKEEISHRAEIQKDGTVVDTLTIKRIHEGVRNEQFIGVRNNDWLRVYVPLGSELIEAGGFSKPDDIYFSKPEKDWETDRDVVNTEGRAIIHTVSGTKIYEENGKTVFANWSQVDPGSYTTLYFKYKLPFKIEPKLEDRVSLIDYVVQYFNPDQKDLIPYALLVQKQPGSVNNKLMSELSIPNNYEIVWNYIKNGNDTGWIVQDDLKTDKYYATILTSK